MMQRPARVQKSLKACGLAGIKTSPGIGTYTRVENVEGDQAQVSSICRFWHAAWVWTQAQGPDWPPRAPRFKVSVQNLQILGTQPRTSPVRGVGASKKSKTKSSRNLVCLVWKLFPHPRRVFLSYLELRSAHIRKKHVFPQN